MFVVTFSHTKTREKKYLAELLKEKKWFEQKQFSVFLPQNMTDIEKECSRENELLKRKIAQLKKTWRLIEADYFWIVKKLHHKRLLTKYTCHVSHFGPEGKYQRPNLIFIRLRTKRDEKRAIETIGHEILHLAFANLFDSKKLNYAEREGMVDALILETDLSKLFPQYEKQSIGNVNKALFRSITHI